MLKNWLVKTRQIKKKEKGFINYCRYLNDENRQSHFNTRIVNLNDSAANILKAFYDRKIYRKEQKLRGGSVNNLATSFVISLPSEIVVSDENWYRISLFAIKSLSKELNIDFDILKKLSHIVLHDESKNAEKHSHVHISVSNIIDNVVVKSISQFKATHVVKQSVNRSVKHFLDVDHMIYSPKNKNVSNVPLWFSRAEKAKDIENKLFLMKKFYKSIKSDMKSWSRTFLADLFVIAEKRSDKIAIEIDELEEISPIIATNIDSIVDVIEELNNDAPKETKISHKRKKRRRKIK